MKLGFYGLVGPNIPITSIHSLYSFFTGNGLIQGAFIHQAVTPIHYYVPTEKTKYPYMDSSICTLPFYLGLHTVGLFPNPIGVANTAFINTGNKQYLLFERDLPYEIEIDVPNKQITTIGRKRIQGINHLSGHTKVVDEYVHSLEYSIWKQSVTLLTLTTDLELVKCQEIKTKYIPLVHDFILCNKSTLFTDSPIQWCITSSIKGRFPIIMTHKPTFIHQVDADGTTTRFKSPHSFFIFHYANVVETPTTIELYAPVYYHLNFDRIDIHGIYSKLRLDKHSKTICITSTPELEKYNLDFPVKWKEYTILRNIKGRTINGFVFCKELSIHRMLDMPMAICGEPSIVEDTLVCIGYDDNFNSYLIQVDLNTNEMEIENMKQKATLGFHSIFIPK